MRRTVWIPLLVIGVIAALAAFFANKFFRGGSSGDKSRAALSEITPLVETVREMARDPDKYQRQLAEDQARAKRELDEKIARDPGNAQLLIDRSLAARYAKDFASALRDIDAAMRLDTSRQYYFLFLRSGALDGLGKQDEALAAVLEAIRLAPPGFNYQKFAADLYRRNGNADAGVAVFDNAVRQGDLAVLADRAEFLASLGRNEVALRDITVAIEREPRDFQKQLRTFDRIKILTKLRRFDEALADANGYIRANPDDSIGYGLRAEVYRAMGSDGQAKQDEDKAMSLGPLGRR